MNPDVKTKWVNALRFGGYTQGQGRLRNREGGFCCLGVLCDIASRDGIIDRPWTNENGEWCFGDMETRDSSNVVLPNVVERWAGLDFPAVWVADEDPVVGDGDHVLLSDLNDGGLSFEKIADLIERNL